MAYGPHAVARADGKVVFVRGAAPGEEVDVAVREDHSRFAFADVLQVVRPSPERRATPCPYLPRCGGCPWQHLEYEAQLRAKRTIVDEHLRRIAGLDVAVAPPLAAPREFGYRQRLRLRVEGGQVGFYAGGSHDLVAVEHCLLAEPAVDGAIPIAAELVRALRTRARRIEIVAAGESGGGLVLIAEAEGRWVEADEGVCRAWLARYPAVGGLLLSGRGWRRSWGETKLSMSPTETMRVAVHAGTFTQVNPEVNRLLVRTVLDLASPLAGGRVLDLYAGAGNLSLPLAERGAEVTAVEQSSRAAADATAAAERIGLRGYRVVCERAESAARTLAARGERFDLVVLDPPRSGARGLIEPVLALRPRSIIYVSCDPATLARDLRDLGGRYRVDRVQPIDMFPQTYHVETVARAIAAC
jgi:23S rRNA (uracil1939-C5)-methyltransferase